MKHIGENFAAFLRFVLLFFLISCTSSTVDQTTNYSDSSVIAEDSLLSIKALTGTLNIVLDDQGTRKDGYWLYINQTLMETGWTDGNNQQRVQLVLMPGEYEVEVAVARNIAQTIDCFPFVFMRQTVTVSQGEITNVPLTINVENCALAAAAYQPFQPDEEWYNSLLNKVKETDRAYGQNRVALALNQALNAFIIYPPVSDKVFIDLPEQYGGGREFNAAQIRKIVAWLLHELWDWFPSSPANMNDPVLSGFTELEKQVEAQKKEISGLNKIAEQLERRRE